MPAGRPTKYTKKFANEICAQIADNQSLRTICKKKEMPSMTTIMRWLQDYKEFETLYVLAHDAQADAIYEDIIDIETAIRNKKIDPQSGRVLIESMRWRAGKMRPKKYGERHRLEVDAGDNIASLVYTVFDQREKEKAKKELESID